MADLRASGLGGVPKGETADRPSSPSIGDVFYNGTLGCLEIYTSQGWVANSAPPAVPTINSVSQSNSAATYAATSSASVSFTSGTGGGLPNSYTVTSSPGGIIQTGASSPIVISGLTNGTQYTFGITATNNFNTSNSFTSSALTPSTKPQAPTIGTATPGNALATVTYTAGDTGGLATTYTVTSSPGNITASGASPVSVTGLTNGTSYTFTVTATNTNGSSVSSATSSVIPNAPVVTDYLVVAGGGAGGENRGAGGGAGGLRSTVTSTGGGASLESSLSLIVGTSYNVTVGAGGTWTSGRGNNGNDSVFDTITSLGGGGGGGNTNVRDGANGGSGGGGGHANNGVGGSGTTGQGYSGGSNSGSQAGASGGGGAGSVGAGSSSSAGGNGGSGVSVSITGSSVAYAGGGGGAGYGGTRGTGGSGGGGNGSDMSLVGTAGTANTGGGGGGGSQASTPSYIGFPGGSGVVILRALQAAASTTGSPVATTSGSYYIYKFNNTGSITF